MPLGAGRMRAQAPGAGSDVKRASSLLSELERTKFEADPLKLEGNAADPRLSLGDATRLGAAESPGTRLILYEDGAFSRNTKVAIGVGSARGIWFQYEDVDLTGGCEWFIDGARRVFIDRDGNVRIGTGAPNSILDVGGPVATDVATATANVIAAASLTIADAAGGSFTVSLRTAVGITGRRYSIKRINAGANTVTVDGNASETIDGALTKVLGSQYAALEVVSDGANWVIVSQMGTVS